MKKSILFLVFMAIGLVLTAQDDVDHDAREYYQLKIYSFDTDDQMKMTDTYLKQAYLPGLKRAGIEDVGVFKPRPTDSIIPKKLYVLIPFASLTQFESLEDALWEDAKYLTDGNAYLQAAHDNKPYGRIASVILRAFPDMPKMKPSKIEGKRADLIYELRSYEGPTEALYRSKVDMFNAGGEIKLFKRLGFNAVFYAEVLSGSQMPNLMYMTTFTNQENRDAHWKDFSDSPEWTILKAIPKYQNTVSRNETLLLYPTDYSDY